MSDHPSLVPMRPDDLITFAGVYSTERNADWRWWAFWRPRWITTRILRTFTVTETL